MVLPDNRPHSRSESPRLRSDGGSAGVGSGWKLLPSLSTGGDKSRPSTANAPSPVLPSSPSSLQSPMASLANAFSIKKRLSDSITDNWSRRRPSLTQGPGSLPSGASRSKDGSGHSGSSTRSRSSSTTTATAGSYSRNPPPLTSLSSSASLATISSTNSVVSTTSSRGVGLRRHDSYDTLGKNYASSISNRDGMDSPTVTQAFEPPHTVRHIASKPITSTVDIPELDESMTPDFQGGYWENPVTHDAGPTNQAMADTGMTRTPGLSRKISDSKRVTKILDKSNPGDALNEEDENEGTLLGAPPGAGNVRDSVVSGTMSITTGYDLTSDEESTSSSLRSIGTKSTSGSSKTGPPHTVTPSHPQKRSSKGAHHTPPVDLQSSERGSSLIGAPTLERHIHNPSRPQSSTGLFPSRIMTASPLKSGMSVSSSGKRKIAGELEVPSDDSASRLSSLAGKVSFPTPSGQKASAASSRSTAPGSTASSINRVSRSDSNSSTASTSTTNPQSVRPDTPSASAAQRRPPSSRERKTPLPAPVASTRGKPRDHTSTGPPLPDPSHAPDVAKAPASGMYWYKAQTHGLEHKPLRAHTCSLVGSNVYVFGGCDLSACFNSLHVLDADSMSWSRPHVYGDIPPPLRAMTCTAVRNKLVIFGGGDGPTYYNDVYIFDTTTSRYSRPQLGGGQEPCRRRAHTACFYKNGIYIFGGGDGVRALNDVWRLDVADLNKPSWKLVSAATPSSSSSRAGGNGNSSSVDYIKPHARGYHTANMVGSKLIIYGGSDGDECFKDVWVFDVETTVWRCVDIKKSFSRLSHTATVIGSYLFVVGGHDGIEYSSEVLLLNLGMLQSLRYHARCSDKVPSNHAVGPPKSVRDASNRPRIPLCRALRLSIIYHRWL
jgi:hypothetical protein